jgi:hypothetical protein
LNKIRKRLTYANVMSTIAAFLALGRATALAAAQIGKNTGGTARLQATAVTTGKIAGEAVKAGKLAKDAVANDRNQDGAVSGSKTVNGAVTTSKIANGGVGAKQSG